MIPILKSYWYYKCSTTHYSLWVQLWTNPHPKFHVANCVDGEPSGAHNLEWATLWCPCNGIFTNQFIFRSTSHKFWLQNKDFFTWALLTGLTHLPGLVSPWKKWEISAQIPRWERGQRRVVARNSRNKANMAKHIVITFTPFIALATVVAVSLQLNWIVMIWKMPQANQNDAEFIPLSSR